MELRYGQLLSLKKNIDLDFYCDGILPVGQMGYQETHYKIKFNQASIILPQSLVSELFEEYKIQKTEPVKEEVCYLNKFKKDELIELVKAEFPELDYSKLKKDELIEILEANTNG